MTPPPDRPPPRPRVACLLPAWNPGARLDRTLDSLAQQETSCEIFVVDDGSEPPIEVPPSVGGHPVHRIRMPENRGIAAALNVGLKEILARDFEYIARHDAGDIDVQGRLARQMEYLDRHPETALVGSSAEFYDERGVRFTFRAPTDHASVCRKMKYSAAIVHSTCMFRSSALRAMEGYSEADDCAEDYELFFRMAGEHRLANLPDLLVRAEYNIHGISISQRRRSLASRLHLQRRFFDPWSLHSYLGMAQTLVLFALPTAFVASVKRRVRSDGPALGGVE